MKTADEIEILGEDRQSRWPDIYRCKACGCEAELEEGFESVTPKVAQGPPMVCVYGVITGSHIHYVGSTHNLWARLRGLMSIRGNRRVRRLLQRGAKIIILKRCEEGVGYAEEGREIERLKTLGQCEINRVIPRKNRPRHITGSLCHPVRIFANKMRYESMTIAAFHLGVSTSTIRGMIHRKEAAYDWPRAATLRPKAKRGK